MRCQCPAAALLALCRPGVSLLPPSSSQPQALGSAAEGSALPVTELILLRPGRMWETQFYVGLEFIFSPWATCLVGALGLLLLTCHGLILVSLEGRASVCGSDLRPVWLHSSELQVQLPLLRDGTCLTLQTFPPWAGPCTSNSWQPCLDPA